jgi:hypothetical protein
MGHIDLAYAVAFFKILHQQGKLSLFDNMTYHDYVYNPDANRGHVAELRRVLDQYAPGVKLRLPGPDCGVETHPQQRPPAAGPRNGAVYT